MLSKNHVKLISSLHDKKGRKESGFFIAEGEKIVSELLQSEIVVKTIYTVKKEPGNTIETRSQKPETIEINEEELKKISALITPNKILAVCKIPEHKLNKNTLQSRLTLVLDDIKDPGNLGTIIRIADWYGINEIICSEDCVDVYNPKTIQATMGSIARIKVHYSDIEEILKNIKSIPVYGALLEGDNIYKKNLTDTGLIIIGNESKGISEKLFPYITDKVSIPSFSDKNSGAESLNAAIATAIICSEFKRKLIAG